MYRFVFHSVGLILFCKGVFICNCEPLMRLCVAGCFCDQTLVLGCLSSARGRSWTLSDCVVVLVVETSPWEWSRYAEHRTAEWQRKDVGVWMWALRGVQSSEGASSNRPSRSRADVDASRSLRRFRTDINDLPPTGFPSKLTIAHVWCVFL